MIYLTSTSDLLGVITGAAVANILVHASWADLNGTTVTPGRTNTSISTATTTTVVASPAASTYRTVKFLSIRNTNATTANDITVTQTDGTTVVELIKVTLSAGDSLHYDEMNGFQVKDSLGRVKYNNVTTNVPAVNATNLVVLAADVINNNATANTMADVTGLSFAVTADQTYFFRFTYNFTSAASTTGSRWSVSGPGSPTRLAYRSQYALTTTSETVNNGLAAYNLPATANATATATGANIAIVEGFITPSADGTVIGRFASEISSSAVTAKAGSLLEWYRVL